MAALIRRRCEPLDGSTCDRPAVEGLCVVQRGPGTPHGVTAPPVEPTRSGWSVAEIDHLDDPDVPTVAVMRALMRSVNAQ